MKISFVLFVYVYGWEENEQNSACISATSG